MCMPPCIDRVNFCNAHKKFLYCLKCNKPPKNVFKLKLAIVSKVNIIQFALLRAVLSLADKITILFI